jgi:hypothetical protein
MDAEGGTVGGLASGQRLARSYLAPRWEDRVSGQPLAAWRVGRCQDEKACLGHQQLVNYS